jgi:hypothetical protein
MLNALRILAAASLLAATASITNAAPVNVGQEPGGVSNGLVQIHGGHRSCERGPRGWHRHNRYGDAVIVANGVATGVALTTVSGSVGSTSATIELRIAQSEETARTRSCAPAIESTKPTTLPPHHLNWASFRWAHATFCRAGPARFSLVRLTTLVEAEEPTRPVHIHPPARAFLYVPRVRLARSSGRVARLARNE